MPHSKVIARYENAISTGQLRPDDAQRQVAHRFGKAVAKLEAQAQRPGLMARITRRKAALSEVFTSGAVSGAENQW